MNTTVDQVLVAVEVGIITAVAIGLWRRARQVFARVHDNLDALEAFTAAWSSAARLEAVIREAGTDINTIVAQLGTEARRSDWPALEAYLHDWRHEQKNEAAITALAVGLLERMVAQLDQLVDRTPKPERRQHHGTTPPAP